MDTIGSLELTWTKGYTGCQADFITQDTICFKCGNSVKFVGMDGHERVYLPPDQGGISQVAVHAVNSVFAYAERNVNPSIVIVQFPSLLTVGTLTEGAQLEFICLVFSASECLASISGVPDFQLVIWNYVNGTKLIVQELQHVVPTWVSFNPGNWRQLAISMDKQLTVWTVEQNNDQYYLTKRKFKMPPRVTHAINADSKNRNILGTSSNGSSLMSDDIALPLSSIAGLHGTEAEMFEEYCDEGKKMKPVVHCWMPAGDVLIGCAGGELLKIDPETNDIHILTCHVKSEETELSRHSSQKLAPTSHDHVHMVTSQTSHLSSRPTSMAGFSTSHEVSGIPGSPSEHQLEPRPSSNCTEQCRPITKSLDGIFNRLALHKTALYAGSSDGTLCQLQVTGNHALIIQSHPVGVPITSLSFNPSHHRLAVGSSKGSIYLCEPTASGEIDPHLLFDVDAGNFIAVRSLALSSESCLTLREAGILQLWHVPSGKLVSSLSLGARASALGASPLAKVAVVGMETGHAHFVDMTTSEAPRVVLIVRLHHEAVRHIAFTANGSLALTASSDGSVFVLDGRPSKKFQVLGYVAISGKVVGLATCAGDSGETNVAVACCKLEDPGLTATKLFTFCLPGDINTSYTSKHASTKWNFQPEMINFIPFNFSDQVFGLTMTKDNVIYVISQVTKMILKICVPQEVKNRDKNKDVTLVSEEMFPGHQLPGGLVQLSLNHKWLVSAGGDGRILVRLVTSPGQIETATNAHSFWKGGVLDFTLSPDGQYVYSTGYDGTLCCFQWEFSPNGQEQARFARNAAQALISSLAKNHVTENEALKSMTVQTDIITEYSTNETAQEQVQEIEKHIDEAIARDEIFVPALPKPMHTATWLDFKEYESMVEEDKTYAALKRELREEIRNMRRKLQTMMKDNERLDAIEKLARHEFDLDVEEQKQLHAECNVEVQKLREEKEFENLSKMYLADIIRKECWDDMLIKGRGLLAFNTSLEVYNFPLREQTSAELQQLEIVKSRRRIEMAELAARKEIVDSVMVNRQRALQGDTESNDAESSADDNNREVSTLMGSLADVVGNCSELYYNQFDLCSREQKMNQIVLLQDTIHKIKVQYNKEFDEVFAKKEVEIAKIKERNKRIGKILSDLNINDPLYHPELGSIERPEMLLVTTDDEVKVEKFMTPEQWKKMEEDRKSEEERRIREKADNWRERGLDQMMGGVLEIKKEDELKKDIPIPLFLQEKREEEFTDDEKKAAAEYHRKVKELEEERDKFRKQLELELRKLQTMVLEGTQNFDEILMQLFMKKVRSELVVYQEELKILRLRYSILQEEEMANRERDLIMLIDEKRQASLAMSGELVSAKKQMDEFRTDYEILVADDKTLDKGFRREFADVSNMVADQLYKHFRKRPRGQKAKILDAAYDASSANPFSDRPSTAKRNEEAQRALDAAVHELDTHLPENMTVDPTVWERLCQYRREKIDCEARVKQKALILADMQAFVQRRHEEDERLKMEVEDLSEALNKLRSNRQIFFTDLEIQLLLKQGQVEVDPGKFIPDYRNCLLLHRSVVEDLNHQVKQLSDSKIASMVESKDFRKGIVQLEWEHKKMTMEMEDLQNRMRDIVSMKVTREIQCYLTDGDYDNKKVQEIAGLEQTIQVQKLQHERMVKEKKRTVKQIKRSIEEMMEKNDALMKELESLNVAVNERRHIHDISGEKKSDLDRKEHYREIVQRRRLVDLAKAQSQEVAILRAEVERLRMRTFAALVQVEH